MVTIKFCIIAVVIAELIGNFIGIFLMAILASSSRYSEDNQEEIIKRYKKGSD